MLHVLVYLFAALACAVTLYALGWSGSRAVGALACLVSALVAVAVVHGLGPKLSAWHRRRARSLFDRSASTSAIWGPMAVAFVVALAVLQEMHMRIAGWLS
jgi:hypothetical protein